MTDIGHIRICKLSRFLTPFSELFGANHRFSLKAEVSSMQMRFRSEEHCANEIELEKWWERFEILVPNNAVALEFIFKAFIRMGLLRCDCGEQNIVREPGSRTYYCLSCDEEVWFTAGTIFYRVRHFKAWLGAIWLMENDVMVSSCRLSNIAKVAPATAFNIVNRVRALIEEHIDEHSEDIPANLFLEIMTKRSRSSIANLHPGDEQRLLDQAACAQPAVDDYDQSCDIDLDDDEQIVWDCLSYEAISADSIHALTGVPSGKIAATLVMLELFGLVECYQGALYMRAKRNKRSSNSGANSLLLIPNAISASVYMIWSVHHGASLKWMQGYVAALWLLWDKHRWPKGSLMRASLSLRPDKEGKPQRTVRSILFPKMGVAADQRFESCSDALDLQIANFSATKNLLPRH